MSDFQQILNNDPELIRIRTKAEQIHNQNKKEYDRDFFKLNVMFSTKNFEKVSKIFEEKCDINNKMFSIEYQKRANEIIKNLKG